MEQRRHWRYSNVPIALYWWSKPWAWKFWHIFGGVCGLTWSRKSAANKATRIGTSCGTDSNCIVSGYGTECQLVAQQISKVEGYWCYWVIILIIFENPRYWSPDADFVWFWPEGAKISHKVELDWVGMSSPLWMIENRNDHEVTHGFRAGFPTILRLRFLLGLVLAAKPGTLLRRTLHTAMSKLPGGAPRPRSEDSTGHGPSAKLIPSGKLT